MSFRDRARLLSELSGEGWDRCGCSWHLVQLWRYYVCFHHRSLSVFGLSDKIWGVHKNYHVTNTECNEKSVKRLWWCSLIVDYEVHHSLWLFESRLGVHRYGGMVLHQSSTSTVTRLVSWYDFQKFSNVCIFMLSIMIEFVTCYLLIHV